MENFQSKIFYRILLPLGFKYRHGLLFEFAHNGIHLNF